MSTSERARVLGALMQVATERNCRLSGQQVADCSVQRLKRGGGEVQATVALRWLAGQPGRVEYRVYAGDLDGIAARAGGFSLDGPGLQHGLPALIERLRSVCC